MTWFFKCLNCGKCVAHGKDGKCGVYKIKVFGACCYDMESKVDRINLWRVDKDLDEHNLDDALVELCENCNEEEVKHKGDWCDNCNLPEKQHPFNTSPNYNSQLREQNAPMKVGVEHDTPSDEEQIKKEIDKDY